MDSILGRQLGVDRVDMIQKAEKNRASVASPANPIDPSKHCARRQRKRDQVAAYLMDEVNVINHERCYEIGPSREKERHTWLLLGRVNPVPCPIFAPRHVTTRASCLIGRTSDSWSSSDPSLSCMSVFIAPTSNATRGADCGF